MGRGKFIAIEGPDGSGKATQCEMLISKLQKEGIGYELFDFPQYEKSIFGKIVGDMLAGRFGEINTIHPMLASLAYAADRYKAAVGIRNTIAEGKIAIANRFTLANKAHQSARLPADLRWDFINEIDIVEHSEQGFNIPRPDVYFYLDVPTEISQELILKKKARAYLDPNVDRDLLERDINHQIEAAKMYKLLAENLEGITKIECCDDNGLLLDAQIIHNKLWQEVSSYLSELREGKITRERQS